MNVDDEVDRLYGLPLEEFTAERNALARELRKAGDGEAADQVKALPKPSIAAWAVNQLTRTERLQVRSLLTAGESLRKAQEELLAGGSVDELRGASERQRQVVAALVESGAELLRSVGHPATAPTLDRIRGTLSAAAADEEGTRLVQEGRLSEDLEPSGFGPLAPTIRASKKPYQRPKRPSADRAPMPDTAKKAREDAARKERIEETRREVDRLRGELQNQRARAHRAQNDAKKARRAADAAQKAAEKEEQELDELRKRVEAARLNLERARSR